MKLIRKQEREFFSMPRDKSRENLNAKNEFIIDFGGQNDIENNKILITLEKTPENKSEETYLNNNLKIKNQIISSRATNNTAQWKIKGSLSSSCMNSPIPSLLLPLWQNESLCETIGMKYMSAVRSFPGKSNHFHVKCFAQALVLKKKQMATQKWE